MTADQLPIAVTGASGALGGRVASRLARAGASLRLVVRDAERAPELSGAGGVDVAVVPGGYGDERFGAALDGVRTLFLVSATESLDRVQQHLAAVDAARAAGVQRIVYTSFLAAAPDATFTFARDHFRTEQHVRASGAAFTFLRPSLYLDLVPLWVGRDDVIRGPAGDGRVAWIARDDLADVAAVVLLAGGDHDGCAYDVTGPAALTVAETAAQLSDAAGRPIAYLPESIDEARASRARGGAAAWEIEGWITSYAAIATGEMDVVSDVVERVAGHPPRSLEEWLRSSPIA